MINSDYLIHQSDVGTKMQFAAKVENMSMRPGELEQVASQLGVEVSPGSDWREYRDALSQYSLKDVTYAMEKASD